MERIRNILWATVPTSAFWRQTKLLSFHRLHLHSPSTRKLCRLGGV